MFPPGIDRCAIRKQLVGGAEYQGHREQGRDKCGVVAQAKRADRSRQGSNERGSDQYDVSRNQPAGQVLLVVALSPESAATIEMQASAGDIEDNCLLYTSDAADE